MHEVVNHDKIFEITIADDAQILDEEAILGLHAVFTVQKSHDGFLFLIEIADNGFSIVEGAGSEHVD